MRFSAIPLSNYSTYDSSGENIIVSESISRRLLSAAEPEVQSILPNQYLPESPCNKTHAVAASVRAKPIRK
jgi:hypothetical protein